MMSSSSFREEGWRSKFTRKILGDKEHSPDRSSREMSTNFQPMDVVQTHRSPGPVEKTYRIQNSGMRQSGSQDYNESPSSGHDVSLSYSQGPRPSSSTDAMYSPSHNNVSITRNGEPSESRARYSQSVDNGALGSSIAYTHDFGINTRGPNIYHNLGREGKRNTKSYDCYLHPLCRQVFLRNQNLQDALLEELGKTKASQADLKNTKQQLQEANKTVTVVKDDIKVQLDNTRQVREKIFTALQTLHPDALKNFGIDRPESVPLPDAVKYLSDSYGNERMEASKKTKELQERLGTQTDDMEKQAEKYRNLSKDYADLREERDTAIVNEKDLRRRLETQRLDHEKKLANQEADSREIKRLALEDSREKFQITIRDLQQQVHSFQSSIYNHSLVSKAYADADLKMDFEDLADLVKKLAKVDWEMDCGDYFHQRRYQETSDRFREALVQKELWRVLGEEFFASPFHVFGQSCLKWAEMWLELFPADHESGWPIPESNTERWRYTTFETLERTLSSQNPNDPNSEEVKNSYRKHLSDVTHLLGQTIAQISRRNKRDEISKIVDKMAKFMIIAGAQRFRLQLLQPQEKEWVKFSRNEDFSLLRNEELAEGRLLLVAAPGLKRAGDSFGTDFNEVKVIFPSNVWPSHPSI